MKWSLSGPGSAVPAVDARRSARTLFRSVGLRIFFHYFYHYYLRHQTSPSRAPRCPENYHHRRRYFMKKINIFDRSYENINYRFQRAITYNGHDNNIRVPLIHLHAQRQRGFYYFFFFIALLIIVTDRLIYNV